jgi:hypothetical protein
MPANDSQAGFCASAWVQVIVEPGCNSEAYESRSAALNGIDSVRKNAPDAEVHDQTAS